jgi:hypothetical protein
MSVNHCPTCGATVEVLTGREGTSSFRPVAESRIAELETEVERLRGEQGQEVVMHESDGILTWDEPLPRIIAITDALFVQWVENLNRLRRIEEAARAYDQAVGRAQKALTAQRLHSALSPKEGK